MCIGLINRPTINRDQNETSVFYNPKNNTNKFPVIVCTGCVVILTAWVFLSLLVIIMLNGYVKLYRKATKWEWYKSSETFHLFLHLVMNANYKDSKFMNNTIKRGELVTSFIRLSEETGISLQTVRTSLERLKLTGEVTQRSTHKYTIITVCNYDTYNSNCEDDNTEINIQLTQSFEKSNIVTNTVDTNVTNCNAMVYNDSCKQPNIVSNTSDVNNLTSSKEYNNTNTVDLFEGTEYKPKPVEKVLKDINNPPVWSRSLKVSIAGSDNEYLERVDWWYEHAKINEGWIKNIIELYGDKDFKEIFQKMRSWSLKTKRNRRTDLNQTFRTFCERN